MVVHGEPDDPWTRHLVDCAASLVSLLSCVALIRRLCQLPPERRGRLFPRQVLWLGLADVAFSVVKLAILQLREVSGVDLCRYFWLIMLTINISYLMEMFLCLGFAFQAAKWSRGLRMLRYSGVLALVLGGSVVAAEPWWNYVAIDDFLICQIIDTRTIDVAFIALTMACLVISLGSFVLVRTKRSASGVAVERRTLLRSTAYMLKTVVVVIPMVVSLALIFSLGRRPEVLGFYYLASTLQDLNGFADCATYFFLSRYANRGMLDNTSVVETELSFQVAFDNEIEVTEFKKESTTSESIYLESTDDSMNGSY